MLLISITPAKLYAQDSFEEVSGAYANSAVGVELTFPDGWTGGGYGTSEVLQAVVVPGGFTGTEPTKTIQLVASLRPIGEYPIDPSNFVNFYIGDCDAPSIKPRTVSGVQGIEVSVGCPEIESAGRIVAVATEDRLVLVIYKAVSSEFESDIDKFEATIDSLKVRSAINSPLGSGTSVKTNFSQIATVAGELIEVRFVTSAGVLDFGLDEETKTLSFKVFGDDESTIVLVGAVLEGPYIVMIDGEETASFGETLSYPSIETISLSHGQGEHEITITGTQVVPEFPSAALGAISALIGIAAASWRTRFTDHRIRNINL